MYNKNAWSKYDENQLKEVFEFAEQYKQFLTFGKTERRVVTETIKIAEEHGFKDASKLDKIAYGDKVYFVNKNKVIANYKKLIEEGKLKEIQLDNARKEKMQKEIEAQQKSIEQRDMEDEIADKKELLTRAIKELKDKINILQNEVDKSGELQRDFLQNITNNLEKIENNKSSLDEDDRKLLNRNKMILYDCFERAKNTDDLKVNVTIIKDIFEGL